MKKKKQKPWFAAVRGSYIPVDVKGWLTYIPLILLAVLILVQATQGESSLVGRVLLAAAELVALGAIFHWFARMKS